MRKLKAIVKEVMGRSVALSYVLQILRLALNMRAYPETGKSRSYPRIVQLPLTYKCNSRCVMCDVWNMDYSNEANVSEFASFLADPLFSEVRAVGINGGEPSLVGDLPEYARAILSLPKLKSLNIISHGFHTHRLLRFLEQIKRDCSERGVSFHVSISLDGIGDAHDCVRGVSGVYLKTLASIDAIHAEPERYCDSVDVGCTVVKQNVDRLIELDEYADSRGWKIKYRLGIENERVQSGKLLDQFSVLYSPSRQSALEFFHSKIGSVSLFDKFKYFSIFFWMIADKPKRLLGCMWKEKGVTLDSRGELYYCAVASKGLGSLRDDQGERIFLSPENLTYRTEILETRCDGCIHDYSGSPTVSNLFFAARSLVSRRISTFKYKMLIAARAY
jgi:MoaA/NifB/PqqE/SkfB family radical SAM enzyme